MPTGSTPNSHVQFQKLHLSRPLYVRKVSCVSVLKWLKTFTRANMSQDRLSSQIHRSSYTPSWCFCVCQWNSRLCYRLIPMNMFYASWTSWRWQYCKEGVIWMLYLDQVHCNSVFKNMRLKNSLYQCGKSGLRAFYINIGLNDSWQFQYCCRSVVRCLIFVNIN